MKLRKRVIVSTIALALVSQFSALSAKAPVDQQLINEAMPMIDKAPQGFFVTAPYINTLITMNVRVYDSQGEEVLNVRSAGEPVELLAENLPDGEYRYQTVTVFQLDEAVGERGQRTDEAISREFGTFTIKDSTVVQPDIEFNEESRLQDEFSLMDTVLDKAIATLAYAVSPFVSSASAQNVIASSTAPYVRWDDTTSTSAEEFSILVSATADNSSGSWILRDAVGFSSPSTPVISISTLETSAIENSMVISSNGDIRLANSGMFYDKSAQELAIGTGSTPAQISLSDIAPDINLNDETDASQAEWQLNTQESQFWGYTPTTFWRKVMHYSVIAPDNSLSIDASGDTNIGGNLNTVGNVNAAGSLNTTSGVLQISSTSSSAIKLVSNSTTNFIEQLSGDDREYGVFFGPNGIQYSYSTLAPTSSLMVTANGNVGLGTASPQENLHVLGNIRTDDYFRGQSVNPGFWIDETGSGNKGANVVLDGGVLQIQRRGQGFGGFEASIFRLNVNAPAQSFTLNSIGYLGLGVQNAAFPIQSSTGARLSAGGVWQNASSRELKENIHDIDAAQALAAFKELKPVTYNYKVDSEDTYIGFIAEDVPEIVASKDRKTLSSMDMVALLTRVVQDQQGMIEEKALKMEVMEQQLEGQKKQFVQQQEQIEKLEAMIRLVSGLEDSDNEVAANLR